MEIVKRPGKSSVFRTNPTPPPYCCNFADSEFHVRNRKCGARTTGAGVLSVEFNGRGHSCHDNHFPYSLYSAVPIRYLAIKQQDISNKSFKVADNSITGYETHYTCFARTKTIISY